MRLGLHA